MNNSTAFNGFIWSNLTYSTGTVLSSCGELRAVEANYRLSDVWDEFSSFCAIASTVLMSNSKVLAG